MESGPISALRVFACFDNDRDSDLLPRLLQDAKKRNSPFEVFDRSTSDSVHDDYREKLKERMRRIDQVIVLCGEWTHRAPGVSIELRVAQELGKPYFFLKGRLGDCAVPATARISDKLYSWSTINVFRLVTGQR